MTAPAATRPELVEHGDLYTCPCLKHANERRDRGLPPLPIRIGEHVFESSWLAPVPVVGEATP